ncbi:zinc-ribbon domain-containing protein (plasmid) [Aneurinibacillus sp. Ricciae_BoGa-3]|uniref:zinc-ribbon domain-containing protein n=1 Tax=Aneurinibacillus sp. Ricciae_BoGa-3 TaxID=3022697 RepID=UPI002340F148|nr:zinc-ribbon domain-containing protein [Aneurinibacillus sp. Ricciae_BoGa-3]WCK57429.1 zinc-ribbon domain-containing protein [Aneurinibacillus sp. Ricciae_BoGa-3]
MLKIKDANRLSMTHPVIAQEWDMERNGDLTPDDVSYASNKEVYWKCKNKDCNHSWKTRIDSRTVAKKGCPVCARKTDKKRLKKKWKDIKVGDIFGAWKVLDISKNNSPNKYAVLCDWSKSRYTCCSFNK